MDCEENIKKKSMDFEKNTEKKYSLELNPFFCDLQKLAKRSTAPLYLLDKNLTVELTLDDFDPSYPTKNKKKLKFEIYTSLKEAQEKFNASTTENLLFSPEHNPTNLTNTDCKNFAKHWL
jgi:hypothetical protein